MRPPNLDCKMYQPCTLYPGGRVAPGTMELGLGIHGEPGARTARLEPVNAIVTQVGRALRPSAQHHPGTLTIPSPDASAHIAILVRQSAEFFFQPHALRSPALCPRCILERNPLGNRARPPIHPLSPDP